MKKLKVVKVLLQYNGVKVKVVSTERSTVKIGLLHWKTTALRVSFFLDSWIINKFENVCKRGSASGK